MTFLFVSTSIKAILGIFLLFFSNHNIIFIGCRFIQRFYTIVKALLISWQVKIINRKKFAKIILDKNIEIFIVYIDFFY